MTTTETYDPKAYQGLGCAGCGDCCEQIWMYSGFDPERETENTADQQTLKFIKENWQLEETAESGWTRWSCQKWDAGTRLCNAHEERPPICSQYPFYGREPDAKQITNLRCSYLLDVKPEARPKGARPLIPVTVVQR